MELITVDCPLCGSKDHQTWRMLNGHRIAACRACHMRFVNPRPPEAAILRAYTAASKNEALSFAYAYEGDGEVESDYSWTGTYVLERFLKRRPGGSFLDIGAGQGWAVLQALKRGHDAYGYEFGDDRSFEKEPRLSGRIFSTEESLIRSGRTFDLVFLSAVLEHVYDPQEFIRKWMRFLKPGGFFCTAAVPNADSLFIRLGIDSWDGNMPLNHLNYFTPGTLRRLIAQAGGVVDDLMTLGAPVSVSPMNVFRQSRFEQKFWGDNAATWRFAKRNQRPAVRRHPSGWFNGITAAANQLIRGTGQGANLYLIFHRKDGE